MIPESILERFTQVINRFLKLDPQSPKLLSPLTDKSICLHIIDINQNFIITVKENRLILSSNQSFDADLTIKGKVAHLLEMAVKSERDHPIFHQEVSLYGEVRLAQSLQNIVYRLDIDWEEYLAQFTGDIVAHRLGRGFRNFRNWVKTRRKNFLRHAAQYIQEEKRISPTQEEFEKFRRDLEKLRDDLARIRYQKENRS